MQRPLILITDGGRSRSDASLISRVERALAEAGTDVFAIVLREQVKASAYPPATDAEVLELLSSLHPICRLHGVKLLVHGRADLALSAGADGVHFSERSASFTEARSNLGADAILGYSAHAGTDLSALKHRGATYCFYSPVFDPLSKPAERSAVGLNGLKKAAEDSTVPVYALGGITAENIAACREAGAAGAAVIGSGLGADNPAKSVKALAAAWGQTKSG